MQGVQSKEASSCGEAELPAASPTGNSGSIPLPLHLLDSSIYKQATASVAMIVRAGARRSDQSNNLILCADRGRLR